jgi:hypothetical protein
MFGNIMSIFTSPYTSVPVVFSTRARAKCCFIRKAQSVGIGRDGTQLSNAACMRLEDGFDEAKRTLR